MMTLSSFTRYLQSRYLHLRLHIWLCQICLHCYLHGCWSVDIWFLSWSWNLQMHGTLITSDKLQVFIGTLIASSSGTAGRASRRYLWALTTLMMTMPSSPETKCDDLFPSPWHCLSYVSVTLVGYTFGTIGILHDCDHHYGIRLQVVYWIEVQLCCLHGLHLHDWLCLRFSFPTLGSKR